MKCTNCSFGYNKSIINNFSFEFEYNKIYHVKGNNGIGKTTLLRGLSGVMQPICGEVVNATKNDIFFLPSHGYNFFEFNSVQETLDLMLLLFNDSLIDLSYFNLFIDPLKKKTISELSDGQKQLIRLVPLFFNSKKIIILDEPFNSISRENIQKILNALRLVKNKIIIMTSHIDIDLDDIHLIQLEQWC